MLHRHTLSVPLTPCCNTRHALFLTPLFRLCVVLLRVHPVSLSMGGSLSSSIC